VTAGIDLSVDVLLELAKHPNIIGVKLTCANAGKATCIAAKYSPDQFAVLSGQSDWLLPCLIAGGIGCVTGIGNIFPKCVATLYLLWREGKIEEAKKLQGRIALAESACKKGLAATKFGVARFTAPLAQLKDETLFYPRKPYKPAGEQLKQATISLMEDLEEMERSLPDVVVGRSK
jgi:2-keto-3-deoxy-L-rhamnonate aldolase